MANEAIGSARLCAVPESRAQVSAAIGVIAELQRERVSVEAYLADRIAELKAIHDPVIQETSRRIDALAAAVRAYCEGHREELAVSGKTVGFGTGEVCWRERPWSISFGDRSPEAVIEELLKRKLKKFVRIKQEVDKRAILSERVKMAESFKDLVSFERGENFVIKPNGGAREDLVLPAAKSA
jgi:phage host-nuclease inhibitor protein Gam